MATHKAYVQRGPGAPVALESVPTPEPVVGQVLVKVLATPILSYTDAVLSGKMFPIVYPLTPGIAAVARVISVGPDATLLREGRLVHCNPAIRSRDELDGSPKIRQGWFGGVSAAARKLMEGTWRNGTWQEAMLLPTENVVPLDEHRLVKELGYSIAELCWMNELLVPLGGWIAAGMRPGCTVMVAPASGHFGGAATQLALALGARKVLAVGRSQRSLRKLEDLDADGRVRPVVSSGDVERGSSEMIAASPDGLGVDIYLDLSPAEAADSLHPQACIAALPSGGTVVLMGGVRGNITLNYSALMTRNITVKGIFMYGFDAPRIMRGLLESGSLSLKGLQTDEYPFGDLTLAVEHAAGNSGMGKLTVLKVSD